MTLRRDAFPASPVNARLSQALQLRIASAMLSLSHRMNSCMDLVNSDRFFTCLLANYTSSKKIEFFVKITNKLLPDKRLFFINLKFVKSSIRDYVKKHKSFDVVLRVLRLQLLTNCEKKAVISDYFGAKLRFLQDNFYTLLNYLGSMIEENKLAFICLFFVESYEINNFDWRKLLQIIDKLPVRDRINFLALAAVQRALRRFAINSYHLALLRGKLSKDTEFIDFLSLYSQGNDLRNFSDNSTDFIELLKVLPKQEIYPFIAVQAEKIEKFSLALTLEKLNHLIKTVPEEERWLVIQLPHIQTALSKTLGFNTKNAKLLLELFPENKRLAMINLKVIQTRLRKVSLDFLLEIVSSIPVAQRCQLTKSTLFANCLAKECYSIEVLMKILQILPLADRTEFFLGHVKYWFGKRITKESIDNMLDLFPGVNELASFEKIAVGGGSARKLNSVLSQALLEKVFVSPVNKSLVASLADFLIKEQLVKRRRVKQRANIRKR